MRLYLIRHPRPAIEHGICYGRSDVAVLEGEEEYAAQALRLRLPGNAPLYSSPALRCRGLAQKLAAALHGGAIDVDARLLEMDFGSWEMRRWDDIPREEIDAWAGDLLAYPPGGKESVLQFARRVHAFYEELRSKRQDAIVVCHAGTIRLLRACQPGRGVEAIALEASSASQAIDYASLVLVDC